MNLKLYTKKIEVECDKSEKGGQNVCSYGHRQGRISPGAWINTIVNPDEKISYDFGRIKNIKCEKSCN